MPLTLLLPLVVGGIIGIVLLVHVTRDRRPARLPDRDTLERLWRETAPDQRASIILAKDGCSALVSDDGEALGLFWLVGGDPVVRTLSPGSLRAVIPTDTGLTLHLASFDAPTVRLALSTRERDRWAPLLARTLPDPRPTGVPA